MLYKEVIVNLMCGVFPLNFTWGLLAAMALSRWLCPQSDSYHAAFPYSVRSCRTLITASYIILLF